MIARIAVEKVPKHFDRLLKQAERRGARPYILDRSRVVAALVPLSDIARLIGLQQHREAHPYRILNVDEVRVRFPHVLHAVTTGKRAVVIEQGGRAVAGIISAKQVKSLRNPQWSLPDSVVESYVADIEDAVARAVMARFELR